MKTKHLRSILAVAVLFSLLTHEVSAQTAYKLGWGTAGTLAQTNFPQLNPRRCSFRVMFEIGVDSLFYYPENYSASMFNDVARALDPNDIGDYSMSVEIGLSDLFLLQQKGILKGSSMQAFLSTGASKARVQISLSYNKQADGTILGRTSVFLSPLDPKTSAAFDPIGPHFVNLSRIRVERLCF